MENEEEEELVEQPVASVQVPVHMSPASSSVISEKMPSDINSGVIEIATPEEIRYTDWLTDDFSILLCQTYQTAWPLKLGAMNLLWSWFFLSFFQ